MDISELLLHCLHLGGVGAVDRMWPGHQGTISDNGSK